MTGITIYKSNSCQACAQVVPAVQQLASRKGIQVKIVDIDQCHTERCNNVQYVPYILYGNREVTPSQLKNILS